MAKLPNLLSGVRFSLVPVLLALAWTGHARVFLSCLFLSITTDVMDGFVARRLNLTSELGAKLDSWADFITNLALPFCAWWLRPEVIRGQCVYLAVGIFSYLVAAAIGFMKFKRLTSYHTWSGKVSAVLLAAAALVVFAGGPGWVLRIVMPLVVLAELEEIAITVVLPQLTPNVPSVWHALKIGTTA
jgi:phosphatidylglycerophosphate synthase